MPSIQPRTIHYAKIITRRMVRAAPFTMFIFGDNAERTGLGGQAKEMRGEPNAYGIATKQSPAECWTDATFTRNKFIILEDIQKCVANFDAQLYDHIIFPEDGIGTGLARLRESAPLTWSYLNAALWNYLGILNVGPRLERIDPSPVYIHPADRG